METLQPFQCVRLQDQSDIQGTQKVRGSLEISSFVGTWVHTNNTSPEIAKIKISVAANDGVLTMCAFSAGDPEPYDWGEVNAGLYTEGVGLHAVLRMTVDGRITSRRSSSTVGRNQRQC